MDENNTEKTESAQIPVFNENTQSSFKRKRLSNKTLIGVVVIGVFVAMLCAIFLPRVFPTLDSLIKQGKYEEAYEIASESEKQEIAIGNIIAWCSAEAYESLSDVLQRPDSFELIDAYYDGKINFVLRTSFRGTLGVKSDMYFYFKYMANGSISLFAMFSDLDKEETYNESASEDERLEVFIKNAAIISARKIVEDPSYKVKDLFIDEVNTLIKNEELSSVELIPQVKGVIESNENA